VITFLGNFSPTIKFWSNYCEYQNLKFIPKGFTLRSYRLYWFFWRIY